MKLKFVPLSLILALVSITLSSTWAANLGAVKFYKTDKQEQDVKDFRGIAIAGPISAVVTLGNTESVRLEGDPEAISTLITEVKGNVLIIRPQTSWTSWSRKYNGKKITAYITAKTINTLTMSGNGEIKVNGLIKQEGLTTTLSGSGNISANINVDHYNGIISGSGNLNMSGTAGNAEIAISGSGSVASKDLSVGNLSVAISGSGSVNVNANKKVEASISGSGNVVYSGNAVITNQRSSGSGRVRKI